MTKVIHSFEKDKISKDCENPCFNLTNNQGGYLSLSNKPISKYQGLFFNNKFEVFKTINNIELLNEKEPKELINKFNKIERTYEGLKETFFMPKQKNGLIYSLNKKSRLKISLDCRKIFDMREWGRYYKISEEKGKIIIKYSKKNNEKEPCSTNKREGEINDGGEYFFYLVIYPDSLDYKKIENWHNEHYAFDEKRGFCDSGNRYVFDAIELNCKKVIFSFSKKKKEAIKEAESLMKNIRANKPKIKGKIVLEDETNFAYLGAQNSINQLVQTIDKTKGIYAGIWWFVQYWTRDTGVSLKSLILKKEDSLVKEILKQYVKQIKKGQIPNRLPISDLKSTDGTGWIFKRLGDFIDALEKEKELDTYLSNKELKFFKNKLKKCINDQIKNYTSDDLAINSEKETWMDTSGNTNDIRNGARIEVQALRLNMYQLLAKLSKLTNDKRNLSKAKKLEKKLKEKVRKYFWNGEYLKDGKEDSTIRPNIFLAYYLYPNLLTKKEWITCFNTVLPKLWCKWGGLTTIDKNNPLYCPYHTGENNNSYHRGDSWYWINNIAAICMYRINHWKYHDYIEKIKEASTNEILWQGCIGAHTEISSAEKQESWGCLNQAWSNATYIELINELFK
mgnify:CR=1 FL=1